MQSKWNENRALLCGRLEGEPAFSHTNHGARYYLLPLTIRRLSGAEDRLNVMATEQQLEGLDLRREEPLTVRGEVRTFNNRSGMGNRLVVSVFARELEQRMGEDENLLALSGTICKPPTLRTTPLGRTICDMILAVNRRYGRADYLPCIAWGSLAHHCGALSVGDPLRLTGRLQSRTYTKLLEGRMEERTAFEVSIMSLSEPEEPGEKSMEVGWGH